MTTHAESTLAQDLPETTFAAAIAGRRYLTAQGHEVLVTEPHPGSHVIAETRKGRVVRIPAGQPARGPLPEVEAVPAAVPEASSPAPRSASARDPRLPEAGTPIMKLWRKHQVAVTEGPDGTFRLIVDGVVILPAARSLTACAKAALELEGVTSPVNGYAWFRVGVPEAAPRPRKERSIAELAARVADLTDRFGKAVAKAAALETELAAARAALAEAEAAEVAPTPVAPAA